MYHFNRHTVNTYHGLSTVGDDVNVNRTQSLTSNVHIQHEQRLNVFKNPEHEVC